MAAAQRVKIKQRKLKLAQQTAKAKTARRVARRDAAANDPALITAPLTPKTAKAEEDALARTKFDPLRQQNQAEQRVSDEQQRRLGSWYDDYLARTAAAQSSTAQGFQQAGQQIDRLAATDTASSGSEDAQKALTARQALIRSGGALNATQGANANAYLADRGRIGSLQKVQAQTGESNRKRTIVAGLDQIARDEGDFRATTRINQRTSERNNQIANATLGLNVTKAASDAQAKRADAKLRKLTLKNTAANTVHDNTLADRQFSSAAEKDAYQRKNHLGPYKLPTKGGRNGTGISAGDKSRIIKGRGQIETARRAAGNGTDYRAYVKGAPKTMPRPVLNAAWELEHQGYVGSTTLRDLKALGITVPPDQRRNPGRSIPRGSRAG